MERAGFNVVVGSFEKNGTIYHAAITAPVKSCNESVLVHEFKVLFSHPQKKTVSFNIKLDANGQWIPDNRELIDPWIANNIGTIIEFKILRKK